MRTAGAVEAVEAVGAVGAAAASRHQCHATGKVDVGRCCCRCASIASRGSHDRVSAYALERSLRPLSAGLSVITE